LKCSVAQSSDLLLFLLVSTHSVILSSLGLQIHLKTNIPGLPSPPRAVILPCPSRVVLHCTHPANFPLKHLSPLTSWRCTLGSVVVISILTTRMWTLQGKTVFTVVSTVSTRVSGT
jgi:hypothetical protein